MRQVLLPLNEEKEQLVQLGFARFSDNVGTKAVIDEPLALLAASAELGSMPDFSLGDRIKHRLLLSDGRGEKFKEFIGFYFASAFGDGLDLCNIFDFGEAAPQWSKQGVELVSVSLVGEQVNAYPFHLPSHVGATLSIGKKCSSVEETLDWFKEPSTVLCFPDKLMGPDIVLFVRLACGLILAVLVQIKWISKSNFTKGTQYEALWSIQPSNFYSHKVHKEILYDINNTDYSGLQHLKGQRYSDARTRICEMLRSLNKPHQHIESEGWFEDGLPVLKVAASFPIGARQDIPPQCASLNMEWCLRAVDSKHLLNTVALALGVFNPLAQEGVGEVSEPPVKKHRFS